VPLLLAACATHPPIGSTGAQSVAVRPNETVYDVAKRLNVSVRDIIDANHLSPPYKLTPGQMLIVPVPSMYTVVKGDSLYSIGRKFNVDQTRIAQLNNLSAPYRIYPGQQLQLPNHHGGDTMMAGATTDELNAAAAQSLTPVRSVEAAPLPPPGTQQPGDKVDRSSPAALAPQQQPEPAPPAPFNPPDEADTGPVPEGLIWPVHGTIVSTFGPKPGGLHNDGINIAAPEGTRVVAAETGTVAYAGNELRGFGNLILIRHADGWVTAYAHLASMTVKKGDVVKGGQPIGTVGQTGTIDSPQLHFELRHGKDAVDPTGKLS
jgi:murein DD-endopeptidase MepM/ murein hydrolase activator NlpD